MSAAEQGADVGHDSDWEDAGQLIVPGVEIRFDDDYMQTVDRDASVYVRCRRQTRQPPIRYKVWMYLGCPSAGRCGRQSGSSGRRSVR